PRLPMSKPRAECAMIDPSGATRFWRGMAPSAIIEASSRREFRMTQAIVHVKTEDRATGRVATVTIDNQRRLNCLSSPTIISLTQAFEKLAEDTALRAIILTGAGDKAFIGGADLNELGGCCTD